MQRVLFLFLAVSSLSAAAPGVRAETGGPKPAYACGATKPNPTYPTLPPVSVPSPNLSFGGQRLTTWPPIGNEQDCRIRQLLFNVPDHFDNGTGPHDTAGPSILLQFFKHGSTTPYKGALSYNIEQQRNGSGFILYTIDIQSPSNLKGDFDLIPTTTGHPPMPVPHP